MYQTFGPGKLKERVCLLFSALLKNGSTRRTGVQRPGTPPDFNRTHGETAPSYREFNLRVCAGLSAKNSKERYFVR